MRKTKKFLIIFSSILFIFMVMVVSVYFYVNHDNIKDTLSLGHLASLPASATGIKVKVFNAFFSMSCYMKFTAEPEEIDQFITDSEGLESIHPIPIDQWADSDFFTYSMTVPSWFQPSIDQNSVVYVIPMNDDAEYGFVIVDKVNCTVYVKTDYS